MATSQEIEDDANLTIDAKIVMAVLFGLSMRSTVTYHMRESKPSPRAQAALDLLVEKGYLHTEPANNAGAVLYKPKVDTVGFFMWLNDWEKLGRSPADEYLRGFELTVPIT